MRHFTDNIIKFLITVIVSFMVVAVCWQVFTRYVLGDPSTVTEELLRFLLIWVTLVGGAYAYGQRMHLSINIIQKALSDTGKFKLDLLIQVIVIGFALGILILGGYKLSLTAEGMKSSVMGIPMIYIYSSLIISAVLFVFYAICFVIEDIKGLSESK